MKKILLMFLFFVAAFTFYACSSDSSSSASVEEIIGEKADESAENTDESAADSSQSEGKTLIVYYSYTNNVRTIVNSLQEQIDADVLEVLPAEEGLKYEANNYEIGSTLISAIRENPDDADSYPAIKTTAENLSQYDRIIVATPLWWSNMAAIMQTFLFTYGNEMADKKVGLIVSSASSGISGVESDAKRLIPGAVWYSGSLHIRSSQTSNSAELVKNWLEEINY